MKRKGHSTQHSKGLGTGTRLTRTMKEMARHFIMNSRLCGPRLALRTAMGQDVEHLRLQTLEERFSAIYRKRLWLYGRETGSLSGTGSELENTKSIRSNLPGLLASLRTRTLLDVGCGDFHWMRDLSIDCQYIGVDVAQKIVDLNVRKYASPRRSFYAIDATKDRLPSADTVLCREVLFHLSFDDIRALIRNLSASGFSTLIATDDRASFFNADILSGDFRLLNLTRPPFCFPRSDLCIPDDEVSPGRILPVWNISSLPRYG